MTTKKKDLLRNNEYYDIQNTFDELYNLSKNKKSYKFKNLYNLIIKDDNILLAYRNIKRNSGSSTPGVDGKTINDFEQLSNEELINIVKNKLSNFRPNKVRRVFIHKDNGDLRPLGIPSMIDRIIQQCIKQILEPICEAKFHNQSFGFRPNRNQKHAISRCDHLVQLTKCHYVVDIDIKGFFDNVNHGKLIKQMWSMGIQDKKLICIISKMLKAEIDGEGIPSKGTPQGGILSPLLSNIVLNELDWWLSSQWESFPTRHNYEKIRVKKNGETRIDHGHKYRALRGTDLKEIYFVRYADDFKIFCKDFETANKIFIATKDWLKNRLLLEVSEKKSKIVNLKSNYSEFLGVKYKVVQKRNKYVLQSHMTEKSKIKSINKIKEKICMVSKKPTIKNINTLNATILSLQSYYSMVTNVNLDFKEIYFKLSKYQYLNLRNISSLKKNKYREIKYNQSKVFIENYSQYNFTPIVIKNICIFPIWGIKHRIPLGFQQEICNYTIKGREFIHNNLSKSYNKEILKYLMKNPNENQSVEYNDNRISLYVSQKGKCKISGKILELGNIECHHKIPKFLGGNDRYNNLVLIDYNIHKLIHVKDNKLIDKYLKICNLEEKQIKELNKYRKLVGNEIIENR